MGPKACLEASLINEMAHTFKVQLPKHAADLPMIDVHRHERANPLREVSMDPLFLFVSEGRWFVDEGFE